VRINVSQLLKLPIGATRSYRVSDRVNIAGGDSLVQGEVSLVRTDRGILAKATLHTEVEIMCSRCLTLFISPLTLNIEEEYFPVIDVVSGSSLSPPNEPGCFIIDEHHMLDLTEAIRQYALLAVPMKPLCRRACAGLCPACGRNLNQGICGCPSQDVDPRWSELRKLTLTNDGLAKE
jgi:uncharacterized protein